MLTDIAVSVWLRRYGILQPWADKTMCGISGVFQRDGGEVHCDIVKKMGLFMTHRGPDNFGFEQRPDLAVAHNRLSLLDLSDAGNQPFSTERYVLVYNGEIYNFHEVRERLIREFSIKFKTSSDTEVLFHSLINEGIDRCLSEVRGMFAFAFYDSETSVLLLARDRMGIKPLYYSEWRGGLYFASEIKALVAGIGLKPDPIRTLFSTNNMAEKSIEHTLFKEVRSVNPGCYLRIDKNQKRNVVYYDVLDDFDPKYYHELAGRSRQAIIADFDGLFKKSVKATLISDAPMGAFVSGGVDSSLIAAVATGCDADLKLFTANILGKYSEFPDVTVLAEHLQKEVFDYKFEPDMLLRDWVDTTYHYDCPIVIHVNSIPFSNVARLARDAGVKGVLTGEGADELFLGYPRLLTRRYEQLASFPVTAVKSLYNVAPRVHRLLFPENANTPLTFVNRLIQGFELPELKERSAEKLKSLNGNGQRYQYLTINMLREQLVTLLHRNDRMGMMSSIEARFPFLDERVVKFAINLPKKFKIGRSGRFHNYKHPFLVDKWIVRKTAERYLPRELVNKKKNGFPMFGHKFIKISPEFFRDGWVAEALGISNDMQRFIVKSQDPYFLAKLASVDIFGRIFAMDQSREMVKAHVLKYADVTALRHF